MSATHQVSTTPQQPQPHPQDNAHHTNSSEQDADTRRTVHIRNRSNSPQQSDLAHKYNMIQQQQQQQVRQQEPAAAFMLQTANMKDSNNAKSMLGPNSFYMNRLSAQQQQQQQPEVRRDALSVCCVPHEAPKFMVTWQSLRFVIEPKWHQRVANGLSNTFGALSHSNQNNRQKCSQQEFAAEVHPQSSASGGASSSTAAHPKIVLDNLDGSFRSGELTAILGPSGKFDTHIVCWNKRVVLCSGYFDGQGRL